MAILLIGSTGNGKSTLGNFLLNPADDHLWKKQTFTTARDNKPQTQHVLPVSAEIEVTGHGKTEITVIDTPGLNESAVRDLEHMIGIVQGLKDRKEVKACIIVVKYNSKIDAQYKATVKYYSELLPDLFEKNVVIVMTDFSTDDRSIQMRKKQGIDVEQVKNNTVREIVECADLSYSPILFTIDCLPFDSDERQLNLSIRDALLQFILLQQATEVVHLRVAKPTYIRNADDEKKMTFVGEISGYSERLQQVHKSAKEALRRLQLKEAAVTSETEKIESAESDLKEMNRSDLVVAVNWSISREWKAFRRLVEPFDLQSKWEIQNVKKWTNGKCEWAEYVETNESVKGKLEGQFGRGIYASLTLETAKKLKYAQQIKKLQSEVDKRKQLKVTLIMESNEIRDTHKEHTKQLEELQAYIEEKREDIKDLSRNYMTLDEARERLKNLKQHILKKQLVVE